MVNVVKLEHQVTLYTDNSTIVLEIETNVERQGMGTFRTPPGIENDIEYQSKIKVGLRKYYWNVKRTLQKH